MPKHDGHVVSVVINLQNIFDDEIANIKLRNITNIDNLTEGMVILSFCDDAWHQICTCAIMDMLQIHEGDEPIAALIEMHASETLNLLFNYFDETQFFDLTNGSVRDYINSLGVTYQPEDYVGEYLNEALYWKVFVFVSTCMTRIYDEVMAPLFCNKPVEVIAVDICPRLQNHYKLTLELF